jgi:hypothetical protein
MKFAIASRRITIAFFKVLGSLALVSIVTIGSASAETSWDTLRRFGLTGVWAYFCDNKATQTNYFETYAGMPNGLARREVDRGIEIPTAISFVENVEIVSATTIRAKIRNSDPNWGALDKFVYDVIITKEVGPSTGEPSRIRFLQAIRSDGKILARDGLYSSSGKPTAWGHRCRTSMSALF